jgi:hypothetical protein
MLPSGYLCKFCKVEILYYNIGFDDGYQCPKCLHILENYGTAYLDKEAIKITEAQPQQEK